MGSMKLRLRGDSLRLRLNRTEVADLIRTGALEDNVSFGPLPGQQLAYAVRLAGSALTPVASFADNRIVVELSPAVARPGAEGEAVGLYSETDWGLKIAVEKDFKCLEPRPHEDETDAFDHPGGPTHCKA